MEMMKLSKFKLKLQTLITLIENQQQQIDTHFHNKKNDEEEEEELHRKIKHLEAELSSSTQQLKRKVQFLEDENYLLQNKNKQLTDTITTILESKESFLNDYNESSCELKRCVESKDKKIGMLYGAVNSHLSLVDSIRKEACFVKELVDNVKSVVDEKEEVGGCLKMEMDKVCGFEELFIEKIGDLESKLRSNEIELGRKDRRIAELEAELDMRKRSDEWRVKIEELRESVELKEGIIQSLVSENKALCSELGMLEVTFKAAIQDAMDEEEDTVSLPNQEREDGERVDQNSYNQEASRDKIEGSPSFKVHDHVSGPLTENDNNVNSCVFESPPSDAANALAVQEKDDCDTYIQHLDSKCSNA